MTFKNGEVIKGKVLVGADGARSAVAKALNMGTPSYAGYSAYRSPPNLREMLPEVFTSLMDCFSTSSRVHKVLDCLVASLETQEFSNEVDLQGSGRL